MISRTEKAMENEITTNATCNRRLVPNLQSLWSHLPHPIPSFRSSSSSCTLADEVDNEKVHRRKPGQERVIGVGSREHHVHKLSDATQENVDEVAIDNLESGRGVFGIRAGELLNGRAQSVHCGRREGWG
ncbi:hypothetical protein BC936DRAFT_148242 [Jimgerdemannia flammicorona]|uniref:Uncharacterized protein n=1 Tax=Jimgerdemannia flammicorona TaxID=994334 RepID=A0A433D3H0_9FUNG|nr:hypothetical protein BC936DRAFT_148242 [Jimgerdemannia flammicorona]